VGAKEQSGRTWPSIFWARGTTVKKIYEIPGFFLTKPSWDREKSVLRRDYFRIFGPIHRKDFFCFEDVKSVPLIEGYFFPGFWRLNPQRHDQ
jgi:hypothetical protein